MVVLGCTHYPLLLDRFQALAPWPITWIDPAPAIARRAASLLANQSKQTSRNPKEHQHYFINTGVTSLFERLSGPLAKRGFTGGLCCVIP